MKKINVLGITLLCGTILTTNIAPVVNVKAAQSETTSSDSMSDVIAERNKVIALVAEAKTYLDYSKYESSFVDTLSFTIQQVEDDLAKGEDYFTIVGVWTANYDWLQDGIDLVKNNPINSSSTESSTIDTTSTSATESSTIDTTSTSTTESSTTDTTSTSTTESSTTDTTSTSTTESSTTDTTSTSATESSTTDTTSSSSTEELKPTINVSDKTMYVGDKLTEEDILNWATFENADGLLGGFEVIGEPILVSQLDNTLIKSGTHQIKFFIEGKTRATEKYIAEKTITLTIKDKGTTDTTTSSSSDGIMSTSTSTSTSNSSVTKTNPVVKVKTIKSETKVLPKTGDTTSSSLVLLGTVTLISGVYVINIKRKRSNNEI